MGIRETFRNKKRIVVKVGSSSLTHPETPRLDLIKMEILVRELSDLRNGGADVVLVTSGAIAVGRSALGFDYKPDEISEKQACAAVGQTRLIMIYQKLFAEYNQIAAQILLTKDNVLNPISRSNARNTFEELLKLHAIPVVNENDTVAVSEIEQLPNFGDNDTMSAVIASLINADLLILLSDIDGLYTDDPRKSNDAKFIKQVDEIDDALLSMGKSSTGSGSGTGGMATKLLAAEICVHSGADMVIANGSDFRNIHRIVDGKDIGTVFAGKHNPDFDISAYLNNDEQMK